MSAQKLADRMNVKDRVATWASLDPPSGLVRRATANAGPGSPGTASHSRGFTLIELMIVVVVIGILAAVAIPNYYALNRRAQEGTVKANMHTVQMSVEDFSLLNDGAYPVDGTVICNDGRNLSQVCPLGDFPDNPFTRSTTVLVFNSDPTAGNPGELGLNPALTTNYILKGNGSKGNLLPLTLTSGQ